MAAAPPASSPQPPATSTTGGGGGGGGHQQRFTQGATNPDDEKQVPPEVQAYLHQLNKAMVDKDAAAAQVLYEVKFPQLTQQFFTQQRGKAAAAAAAQGAQPERRLTWPRANYVHKCFTSNVVESLYAAAHSRSVYSGNLPANMRTQAWDALTHAIKVVMSTPSTAAGVAAAEVAVPSGWLWDVVDELIYQLHMHGNRRIRPQETMSEHVGSVKDALFHLENAVERSGVVKLLKSVTVGEAPASSILEGPPGSALNKRTLGLFALIGIVRLRMLLADYHGALAAAEPLVGAGIPLSIATPVTVKVAAAHASLYYHLGFAYVMLRRYEDAHSALEQALGVKAGHRKFLENLQYYVVCLLVICEVLGGLSSNVRYGSFLSERNRSQLDEDATQLSMGDLDCFREVFTRSCPKFIAASPSSGSRITNQNGMVYETSAHEAREAQVRVFMREVSQQQEALKLRNLLQVYSTVTVEKLATLLSPDGSSEEGQDAAVALLLATKHKSRQFTLNSTPPAFRVAAEVDFAATVESVTVQRRKQLTSTLGQFVDRLTKR